MLNETKNTPVTNCPNEKTLARNIAAEAAQASLLASAKWIVCDGTFGRARMGTNAIELDADVLLNELTIPGVKYVLFSLSTAATAISRVKLAHVRDALRRMRKSVFGRPASKVRCHLVDGDYGPVLTFSWNEGRGGLRLTNDRDFRPAQDSKRVLAFADRPVVAAPIATVVETPSAPANETSPQVAKTAPKTEKPNTRWEQFQAWREMGKLLGPAIISAEGNTITLDADTMARLRALAGATVSVKVAS